MITPNDIIRYGVPRLLEQIATACMVKHEHYAPQKSTFSAWATVIKQHIPQMKKEVDDIIYGREP